MRTRKRIEGGKAVTPRTPEQERNRKRWDKLCEEMDTQKGPTKCAPCVANGATITLEFGRFGKSGMYERYERTFSDTEIVELCRKAKPNLREKDFAVLVLFRLMLSSKAEFTAGQRKYLSDLISTAEYACTDRKKRDWAKENEASHRYLKEVGIIPPETRVQRVTYAKAFLNLGRKPDDLAAQEIIFPRELRRNAVIKLREALASKGFTVPNIERIIEDAVVSLSYFIPEILKHEVTETGKNPFKHFYKEQDNLLCWFSDRLLRLFPMDVLKELESCNPQRIEEIKERIGYVVELLHQGDTNIGAFVGGSPGSGKGGRK